ncbi:MAG TPA: hypothetical protein VFC00_21195 [Micromonosporaceae bacterium]|nr:hypothetical protein [Micromonosporaceae bacterium]
MRRSVIVLAAVALLAAGCAQPGTGTGSTTEPDPDLNEKFDQRARQVAQAWAASTASGAWRTGFVPLGPLTEAPAGGFPSGELKEAYVRGIFVLRTDLPATRPADGTIRFPADRATLTVPLVSAREAYAAIDQGDPQCVPPPPPAPAPTASNGSVSTTAPQSCAALTVTAVRLSTVMVRTSRGEASVPAWLFTVAGVREPVVRVAVVASAITPLPSPSLPDFGHVRGLVTAQHVIEAKGNELTFALGVGTCDTDIRPLFLETDAAVMVAGAVRPPTGVCNMMLKFEPVTVTLAEPLGARVVLDGLNGGPLTDMPTGPGR